MVIRGGGAERTLEVTVTLAKRVGAEVAAKAYIDHTPVAPPAKFVAPPSVRDPGTGRPTKKERRQLDHTVTGSERDRIRRARGVWCHLVRGR